MTTETDTSEALANLVDATNRAESLFDDIKKLEAQTVRGCASKPKWADWSTGADILPNELLCRCLEEGIKKVIAESKQELQDILARCQQ